MLLSSRFAALSKVKKQDHCVSDGKLGKLQSHMMVFFSFSSLFVGWVSVFDEGFG